MIEQVFLDVKNDQYYYVGVPSCDFCKEEQQDIIIFKRFHLLKKTIDYLVCSKCLPRILEPKEHRLRIISESYLLSVVEDIPPNTIPVMFSRPGLKHKKGISVFDAVSDSLVPAERVVDNTRMAGRESFEGSCVGVDVQDLLMQKDAPISSEREAALLLDTLRDAVPVIEVYEKKRIKAEGVRP